MKSVIFHLVIAILVCAAALTGYGIWYSSVSQKSSEVASLQNQIDEKTDAAARIQATQNLLSEIVGDESLLQNYFVPETGVVSFIDDLQSRGKVLGADVSVSSVTTSGGASQPVLLLALSIKGTFDAVMRTIGSIEYAPYDVSVTKLITQQESKGTWRADMNLTVGSVPKTKTASSTTP